MSSAFTQLAGDAEHIPSLPVRKRRKKKPLSIMTATP